MAAPGGGPGSEEADALRGICREMKANILMEKKLLNDSQQQKERIEKFWALEKEKRDDLTMLLRNKLRQKQDLEEKHAFELKVYKQKVKHLLYEEHTHMTDVRLDNETALKLLQDEQRDKQHEANLHLRSVAVVRKEMELRHLDLKKAIRQEQEKKIMHLRQEYERKADELKALFEKKMKEVRDEFEGKKKADIERIENRKNDHIMRLMAKHKQAFDDIKEYFSDITRANLELIKTLKEDVGDMKKKERDIQKGVVEINRIHKKRSKPLDLYKHLQTDLEKKLEVYHQEKQVLQRSKEQLVVAEERVKNQRWEHEIFEQKFELVVKERDTLRTRLSKTIYDAQQKIGFKNLLLEKKIEAINQDLEKTESALAEVLASTNLQPEVVGQIQHSLEDVLMAKNKTIQQLQDHLDELKQRYGQAVGSYEGKLRQFDIPIQELGFSVVRSF